MASAAAEHVPGHCRYFPIIIEFKENGGVDNIIWNKNIVEDILCYASMISNPTIKQRIESILPNFKFI